jgi:hypothetical protein
MADAVARDIRIDCAKSESVASTGPVADGHHQPGRVPSLLEGEELLNRLSSRQRKAFDQHRTRFDLRLRTTAWPTPNGGRARMRKAKRHINYAIANLDRIRSRSATWCAR